MGRENWKMRKSEVKGREGKRKSGRKEKDKKKGNRREGDEEEGEEDWKGSRASEACAAARPANKHTDTRASVTIFPDTP